MDLSTRQYRYTLLDSNGALMLTGACGDNTHGRLDEAAEERANKIANHEFNDGCEGLLMIVTGPSTQSLLLHEHGLYRITRDGAGFFHAIRLPDSYSLTRS